MAKSGTDEHQRTVAIRKCTNGPCTAAYLAIYSFRQVIRADFAELGCNGRRLFLSCFFALLRMDCFEHQGNLLHLSLWRHREDVPVKMDRASLVFGLRKDHRDAFQHAQAFIADNKAHARKAAALKPGEKVQPALSSFMPSDAPRISRNPSLLTPIATKTDTF